MMMALTKTLLSYLDGTVASSVAAAAMTYSKV